MYLHSTIVLHHLPWATSFLSAQFFARTQDKYALLDKWLLIVVTIQITSHQNSPSTWGATCLSVSRNIRGKLLRIREPYLQLWVRIWTSNVSNWGERKWKHWININLNATQSESTANEDVNCTPEKGCGCDMITSQFHKTYDTQGINVLGNL